MPAARQEVLNVLFAQLLAARGLVAAPEQRIVRRTKSLSMPDVIVDFQGLRLVIECEIGRQRSATAYQKASQRVETGLAHMGVAVVYPAKLAEVAFARLRQAMEKAVIRFAVVTEVAITSREAQLQLFPMEPAEPEFEEGTVGDLAASLRRAYDQLVEDATLDKAVALLEAAIDSFLEATRNQPASLIRLAGALEVGDTSGLTLNQLNAIGRIAALILANAMIFQEVLSQRNHKVLPLDSIANGSDCVSEIRQHWQFILDEINYFPIFNTAVQLLKSLSSESDMQRSIALLLKSARKIVGWRASLRHDLAGRIYHRLLEESKHLGAYYTSIPSATLLLKLAMSCRNQGINWGDLDATRSYKIADLACGTGTLLMAGADVAVDNHVRASVAEDRQPMLDELHDILVGNCIYGYDVLASAVHLTASTLTLRVPDRPVNVAHLYRLPLGGENRALGTLEFLGDANVVTGLGFSQPEQVTGAGMKQRHVEIPQLDLCVMNPPFVRSVGGNLLFGNLPQSDRKVMQEKLKGFVRRTRLSASITAGLGSVFVGLADRFLKPGGRIALVLPRALISGVAWSKTRALIAQKYTLEYLVVSHEPDHWNFSENTELSEVLAIARKRSRHDSGRARHNCFCVSLWNQPKNSIEALAFAKSILNAAPEPGGPSASLRIHDRKVGEVLAVSWSELRKEASWGQYCSCAQGELIQTLVQFDKAKLRLPGCSSQRKLPICPLSELGTLGFDRRDIHDGFDMTPETTHYPALWGHNAEEVISIGHRSNAFLRPLSKARPGRNLRKADHLWKMSSRVMISERLWLITMRVVAVRLPSRALANVWWPFVLRAKTRNETKAEKALVLWLNSTLGLLSMLGVRQETRGAWIDFKKPSLKALKVIDPRKLSADELDSLAGSFDRLASSTLEPYSLMSTDPTRAAMDEAIATALKLPDLSGLRNLLAREPILSMEMRHTEPPDAGREPGT